MKPISMFLLMIATLFTVFASLLYAGGTYHIGKDEGGIYMETDQDGSWYIDRSHVQHFSLGETGRYAISDDQNGTFIKTSKGGKYYINQKARERLELDREAFNEKQRQSEGMETKVILLDGTHVLVPVTLGYEGNEMEVLLLLDTGASIMVLHREIVDQLMLKSIRKAKLMVAGGKVLESDIVKLDYVGVGPIKKQGVHASVIQHEGPQVKYQGLLGMNFLKDLDYRVDSKRRVIKWHPEL